MHPRLTSQCDPIEFDGEPRIVPLILPQKPKEEENKEMTLAEMIQEQGNRIVAFIINWVKTSYTKDLFEYLHQDFKEQIKEEILNELK